MADLDEQGSILRYRPGAMIEELLLGECTIHRASGPTGRWWLLWFYVRRETDGEPEDFAVPVNPNGRYVENAPGGKTWGLALASEGVWQINPSINVLQSDDARLIQAGGHPSLPSLWHKTPRIEGVLHFEPWITQAP